MSVSQQIHYSSPVSDADASSHYRTVLMCPPDHFGVLYEINPWMKRAVQPDLALARKQWDTLVSNLQQAGAAVEFIHPVASLPDMVFIADIGLVDRKRFIMSRFRYPQRQEEATRGAHWLQSRNYEVLELPLAAEASLESSDIYPFRGCLLAGYGFRTSISAHRALAHLFQREVLSLQFVDARLYHLDLSFCPLDERRAIIAPCAWSRRGCERMEKLVPEALVLELEEALTFCANSIVVGKTILMPACPSRVARILERWGFTICISPVSEFLKAGGALHCLVLALHGSFSSLADSVQ